MLLTTILLASTASATCLHGLSMFKRAESSDVQINTFGYGPLNGPLNWASLEVANEACKSGANQSPINLDASVSLATEKPILDIPDVKEVEFENLGTTIEVLVNGTTSFAGEDFRLVQFHMHTPSEHHVYGEYFPLEVHMVHQGVADTTRLAVIALLFQLTPSTSSSIIASLSPSLPLITVPGTRTTIPHGVDFRSVVSQIASSDILQYTGSLTTPPCREGVTFLVVKDPLDISVADFNAIKAVVKFNARFIQNALGGVNMLQVAERAGTGEAVVPEPLMPAAEGAGAGNATGKESGNGTDRAQAEAGVLTKGTRFTVTELQGQPTQIPAVVVKRRSLRYSH